MNNRENRTMIPLDKAFAPVDRVHIEAFRLQEPFPDFAASFAALPGTVVLLSGGSQDSARYHILATRPWLTCSAFGERIRLEYDRHSSEFEQDPFDCVSRLLQANRITNPNPKLPIAAGLFGYFSYDLKDRIENLPKTCLDDLHLPDLYLTAPSILVIQEIRTGTSHLCLPLRRHQTETHLDEQRRFLASRGRSKPPVEQQESAPSALRSNYSKDAYLGSLEKIKEYICSGHVYQVNFSQRFRLDAARRGYPLFQQLFAQNPAPFFAYVNAGDHEIVSTSPERFLHRSGPALETRPIKGTRPRSESPEEDQRLKTALQESPKDRAELSMIVDLLRNDLGKVCLPGTVRVAEHRRVETYANVFHLVSIVTGELAPETDSMDCIKAAFPGGSITGCPKVRSMEIIDELETHRRHIYTGSIGYCSFHDTLDLSIAIRTATLLKDSILFSVGGGIVYDSDPDEEYDETLHKGRTLMRVLQGDTAPAQEAKVWFNGLIIEARDARLEVDSPAVQYGIGLFETIRVERGRPCFLKEHLARLENSWRLFFDEHPPELSWETIIHRTLAANGLEKSTAAIKILAAKGNRTSPPLEHSLLVTARPYLHRLQSIGRPGLRLKTYPHPRQTPLAGHKTCNYLFSSQAGRWARQQGADEALILNPDASVSETNSANLLVIREQTLVLPASQHVLPGIMQQKVREFLELQGYRTEYRTLFREDLQPEDRIVATNSLMGTVPVLQIDGRTCAGCSELAREINRKILHSQNTPERK